MSSMIWYVTVNLHLWELSGVWQELIQVGTVVREKKINLLKKPHLQVLWGLTHFLPDWGACLEAEKQVLIDV